jgi:hydrogenase maturation protein HypF
MIGAAAFERDDLAPVQAFSHGERAILKSMLTNQVNTPVTSSAGRLFDAVAALVGLRQTVGFEGQAAAELEFALDGIATDDCYDFEVRMADSRAMVIDWEPLVQGILADLACHAAPGVVSAKFHNSLAEIVCAVARRVGQEQVALTGGCFQNKALAERTILHLQKEGFCPTWHRRIPPNDGGIALGQTVAALRVWLSEGKEVQDVSGSSRENPQYQRR